MYDIFQCINRQTEEVDLEINFEGISEGERSRHVREIINDYPPALYKHIFVVTIKKNVPETATGMDVL